VSTKLAQRTASSLNRNTVRACAFNGMGGDGRPMPSRLRIEGSLDCAMGSETGCATERGPGSRIRDCPRGFRRRVVPDVNIVSDSREKQAFHAPPWGDRMKTRSSARAPLLEQIVRTLLGLMLLAAAAWAVLGGGASY
jgi:hypothetical protein